MRRTRKPQNTTSTSETSPSTTLFSFYRSDMWLCRYVLNLLSPDIAPSLAVPVVEVCLLSNMGGELWLLGTAPASFMTLPALKNSLSCFHPQLNQLWRIESTSHFPLPTSVPKVIYAFTIPRIDSAKKSPLALLGKWGYRKCHFIGIWPAYFICCAFSFCKRRHGEFDGNVTREITFFCAVLKSVPEV